MNETNAFVNNYGRLNRLVKYSDSALNKTIHYAYDDAGNLTQLSWLDYTRKIYYTYGKLNELLKVKDSEGKVTNFKYDALGREIEKIHSNNVTTQTGYAATGRVVSSLIYEGSRW